AVTNWPRLRRVAVVNVKLTLPLASAVAFTAPRKVCPSAMPPAGSGLLLNSSIRYMTPGETDWDRVPVMVVPVALSWTELSTGKFWKLLGSLAAPCPLESLGVRPSSLGKTKPLVRSMPSRDVGLLRPFWKTLLPRMELPVFWIGVALFGSGLPKTA